ncbi:MAG: hypothetical protein ACRELG_01330 [Gemmataceae bacterium]
MSEKPRQDVWPPDPIVFNANRTAVPLEELAKIGNQWSAWSMDGSRIIAHHEDALKVIEMVEALGLTTGDVVMEFIPPGGVDECLL